MTISLSSVGPAPIKCSRVSCQYGSARISVTKSCVFLRHIVVFIQFLPFSSSTHSSHVVLSPFSSCSILGLNLSLLSHRPLSLLLSFGLSHVSFSLFLSLHFPLSSLLRFPLFFLSRLLRFPLPFLSRLLRSFLLLAPPAFSSFLFPATRAHFRLDQTHPLLPPRPHFIHFASHALLASFSKPNGLSYVTFSPISSFLFTSSSLSPSVSSSPSASCPSLYFPHQERGSALLSVCLDWKLDCTF